MICPGCGAEDDKVIDSRFVAEANATRRRRECLRCEVRYTTYERMEDTLLQVIKTGGARQPWDRTKLIEGVRKACEKRPVDTDQLEKLADRVQRAVFARGAGDVSTEVVGALVMAELRNLDPVAYLRFASVYLNFDDVSQFVKAIEALRETAGGAAGAPGGRDPAVAPPPAPDR